MLMVIILIAGFLALSGMMAAIDAAVLSVTHPEIEVLVQNGKWGARRLRRVKHELSQSVVVIVILTNTINVLGPILISFQAWERYRSEGIAIITAVLALGTIVFSEIIPKSVGTTTLPSSRGFPPPAILACRFLLYPLVVSFAWLSNQFTRGTRQIGTEEQIRSLVQIGHRAGHIESDEGQMIHRVFVLNDKTAGEIMTPLDRVKALGATFTIAQAAAEVCRNEFSRYPVFGKTTDEIEGVASSRDVLKLDKSRSTACVSVITRPADIVDAQVKSDELIALFHQRHVQLAVVQDQGKTVGIVTLDDVLEQLIGGIDNADNLVAEPRPKMH